MALSSTTLLVRCICTYFHYCFLFAQTSHLFAISLAVKKSFAEMEALAKRKEEQRKLREARRKAQEARVQEKLKNKVAKTKQPRSKSQAAGDDNEQFDSAPQPEDVEDDDIEWYRQEVGEEPDKEEAAELKAASTQAPTRSKFNPLYRKRKKPDASSAGAKGKGKPGTYKKPKLA